MGRIENIEVGDYLILTDVELEPESHGLDSVESIWGGFSQQRRRAEQDHHPLRVAAISVPFILFEPPAGDTAKAITVDSRYASWTKADADYVRQFHSLHGREVPGCEYTEAAKEPEARMCPECSGKMGERLLRGKWVLSCGDCMKAFVSLELLEKIDA